MTPSFKLLLISTMAFTASMMAADLTDSVALRTVLQQNWTELTVAEMTDQGCVAPVYFGVRLTRTQTGLSIASWRRDEKGERVGAPSEFDPKLLAKFLDSVVSHYAAAVASDDVYEQIAKLNTEAERQQAWARVIKAVGGLPVGGFSSEGIEIRLTIDGRTQIWSDSFGDDGFTQFDMWLGDHRRKCLAP